VECSIGVSGWMGGTEMDGYGARCLGSGCNDEVDRILSKLYVRALMNRLTDPWRTSRRAFPLKACLAVVWW
jgi:hypothetical protein